MPTNTTCLPPQPAFTLEDPTRPVTALIPRKNIDLSDVTALVDDLNRVDWAFEDEQTGFLSHDIHPYPSKFIPQVPGNLIERLSLPGDLVFDPFAGSGTTALEALRRGRRALMVDANSVGILAGRVKTSALTPDARRDLRTVRTYLTSQLQFAAKPGEWLADCGDLIPDIPNREKWFSDQASAELALIRNAIRNVETPIAADIASLALSRIVLRASFQDSETRYASISRHVSPGETINNFLKSLDFVLERVQQTSSAIQYGVSQFIVADSRNLDETQFPSESVDLVVTSPPYGNASDYHLYHRFRLFWLGDDPRILSRMEIGSHLRHQKERTGYEEYCRDLGEAINHIGRMLRPGRFASFVIGDSLYQGVTHSGEETVKTLASQAGLTYITTIHRPIHTRKRSYPVAGRRAASEAIVIVRRPETTVQVTLTAPAYRLWPYESQMQVREIKALTSRNPASAPSGFSVQLPSSSIPSLRRLTFTSAFVINGASKEKTWQAVLENGIDANDASRKDPKYVTHGIHPYKGKFYPQLAKALINISAVSPGSVVLDPFCGSGTTLLESHLNGLSARGIDLNPLAARIARAKIGILSVDPAVVRDAIAILQEKITVAPSPLPDSMCSFPVRAHDEIRSWFPPPVVAKLNWLLSTIRATSAGLLRDFLEVTLSSIVREVSLQEPSDLRIRRRAEPIIDADVFGIFSKALDTNFRRLERFWAIRGYCPFSFYDAHVVEGDSRRWPDLKACMVEEQSVDLVLTSPPYATALPYIDTDRLSLLILLGQTSSERRPLEFSLTGSREITVPERQELEETLFNFHNGDLFPRALLRFLHNLSELGIANDVGFRRRNLPALLLRYFLDMQRTLTNIRRAVKTSGRVFIVMGDNRTSVGEVTIDIPSTEFLIQIAESTGFRTVERIPITVTTENLLHMKNAIRENSVLVLEPCPS